MPVKLVISLKKGFTFTFHSILEQFQSKPDLKHLKPKVGPNINLLKPKKALARESQHKPDPSPMNVGPPTPSCKCVKSVYLSCGVIYII